MVNCFTELNAKTERKQKRRFPEDVRAVERSFYEDLKIVGVATADVLSNLSKTVMFVLSLVKVWRANLAARSSKQFM